MRSRTFEPGMPLLRGNLHTHTLASDGGVSPGEAMAWYQSHGYDFLAITDHWCCVEEPAPDGLLTIPGMELDAIDPVEGMFHMVGLNLREVPDRESIVRIGDAVDHITAAGGLAVLCHPYWCGMSCSAVVHAEGVLAVEVFNTTCETLIAKGLASVHWDAALAEGKRLLATAVDDAHWHYRDYGGGWVMVQAEERTVDSIIAALVAGRFYSSRGPDIIDFWVEDGQAYARTSPAQRISFVCDRYRGACRLPEPGQDSISEATARLDPSSAYVRLEVDDRAGRRAWSNPIYLR